MCVCHAMPRVPTCVHPAHTTRACGQEEEEEKRFCVWDERSFTWWFVLLSSGSGDLKERKGGEGEVEAGYGPNMAPLSTEVLCHHAPCYYVQCATNAEALMRPNGRESLMVPFQVYKSSQDTRTLTQEHLCQEGGRSWGRKRHRDLLLLLWKKVGEERVCVLYPVREVYTSSESGELSTSPPPISIAPPPPILQEYRKKAKVISPPFFLHSRVTRLQQRSTGDRLLN